MITRPECGVLDGITDDELMRAGVTGGIWRQKALQALAEETGAAVSRMIRGGMTKARDNQGNDLFHEQVLRAVHFDRAAKAPLWQRVYNHLTGVH
jgi:hypothetical protein